MARNPLCRPWYVQAARIVIIGGMSCVLWAGALAGPFVLRYVLEPGGTADRVAACAALGGGVLVVIGFLCYLMDRI